MEKISYSAQNDSTALLHHYKCNHIFCDHATLICHCFLLYLLKNHPFFMLDIYETKWHHKLGAFINLQIMILLSFK